MRTGFIEKSTQRVKMEVEGAYKGTPADAVLKFLIGLAGKERVDPVKAAARIVEAVDREDGCSRIPLGKSIGEGMRKRGEEFIGVVRETRGIWESVDFPDGE